jgi:hypothetical protein
MRVPAWFVAAIIFFGLFAMLVDGCKALMK